MRTFGRSMWTSCPCCAGLWTCVCWGVCVWAAEGGRSEADRTLKMRPCTSSLCPDSVTPAVMKVKHNKLTNHQELSEVSLFLTNLPRSWLNVTDSSSVSQSAFYPRDKFPLLAAPNLVYKETIYEAAGTDLFKCTSLYTHTHTPAVKRRLCLSSSWSHGWVYSKILCPISSVCRKTKGKLED